MLLKVEPSGEAFAEIGYSDEEKAAMIRAVLNLFAKWGVSDGQAATLLGGVSLKTVQRWRNGDRAQLSIDQCDRISNLLGIHKALRILFDDIARAYGWIARSNKAFGGKSALEIMLQGRYGDIERVRRYLDSARGGW